MNNGYLPAYPIPAEQRAGLSKREYFSAMALQGLLSDPKNHGTPADVAADAVYMADKLLAALEEK